MKPITGSDEAESDSTDDGLFTNRRRQKTARPSSSNGSSRAALLTRSPARAVLSILGGLGVGYLLATLVLFPAAKAPDDLIEVPNLRGMNDTDAVREIESAGLILGTVDSLLLTSELAGTIIGQSPLPGQLGTDSTTVRLTVSAGALKTPVPDVMGLALDQAIDLLVASGFDYQVDTVESTDSRGVVVSSSPSVGESLTVPSTVRIEVSEGAPSVSVPRLVGLEEAAALALIDSLGLTVGNVDVQFRFGLDQGKVVQQEPAPGVSIERGAPIRLVVGRRGGGGQ